MYYSQQKCLLGQSVAQSDIIIMTIFGLYKSSVRHTIPFAWCRSHLPGKHNSMSVLIEKVGKRIIER